MPNSDTGDGSRVLQAYETIAFPMAKLPIAKPNPDVRLHLQPSNRLPRVPGARFHEAGQIEPNAGIGEAGDFKNAKKVSDHLTLRASLERLTLRQFLDRFFKKKKMTDQARELDGRSLEKAQACEKTGFSEPSNLVRERNASLRFYLENRYGQPDGQRTYRGAIARPEPGIKTSRAGKRKEVSKAMTRLQRYKCKVYHRNKALGLPLRRPKQKDLTGKIRQFDDMIDAELDKRILAAKAKLAKLEKMIDAELDKRILAAKAKLAKFEKIRGDLSSP